MSVNEKTPAAPPLDELLKVDIQIPDDGYLNETVMQAYLGVKSSEILQLRSRVWMLTQTCQSLKAQVDGLKAHLTPAATERPPSPQVPVLTPSVDETEPFEIDSRTFTGVPVSDPSDMVAVLPEPPRPRGWVSPYTPVNGTGD